MSRVHCIDCGNGVVVDPSGLCPEGHHVGSAGQRIDGAIGSATPHPDEPEPWVGRVDVKVEDAPEDAAPRAIRPPAAPGADVSPAATEQIGPDDLLRELHTIGDDSPPADHAPAPSEPADVATNGHANAHSPAATPSSPTEQTEDLTALEAAVHAMSTNGNGHADIPQPPADPPPPPAPTGPTDGDGNDHLDDLDALFTSTPPEPPQPAPAPVPPSDRSSALADVAALANAHPEPEPDGDEPVAADPPPPPGGDEPEERGRRRRATLDVSNFTASGAQVGRSGRSRRRRSSR